MNLYTVEQIELIRRLRQSGIQPEQILEAFRSLDRLEQDLGIFGESSQNGASAISQNRPDSSSSSSFAKSPAPNISPTILTSRESEPPPASLGTAEERRKKDALNNNPSPASMPILLQHLTAPQSTQPSYLSCTNRSDPPPYTAASWSGQTPPSQVSSIFPTAAPFSKELPSSAPLLDDSGRGQINLESSRPDTPIEWTSVNNKEFEDLIQQTTIARMTGVSQPYVSKFLNGNSRELSRRVRMILFKWYLAAKSNPEKIAHFCASEPLIPKPDTSLAASQQRRERYVFRPLLIQVLEHYFLQHQYPDLQKRMEIAADCNRALATERKGGILMKKEHVTPQIIANWFANKRKDNKRRMTSSVGSGGMELIKSGTSIIDTNSEYPGPGVISPASPSPGLCEEREDSNKDHNQPATETAPGNLTEDSLTLLQSQLAAVNSSVLALVNPYDDSSPHVKMEAD